MVMERPTAKATVKKMNFSCSQSGKIWLFLDCQILDVLRLSNFSKLENNGIFATFHGLRRELENDGIFANFATFHGLQANLKTILRMAIFSCSSACLFVMTHQKGGEKSRFQFR